ncbi:glucokinase [Sphingomonas sp. YR710]|nr:glucokinase [Sphingomonas sp. YR710]
MMQIVAVDLGGTHARFSIADLHHDRRPALGEARKYKTADFPDFPSAWAAFAHDSGVKLPSAASIAIAGPVEGELIHFTNNPWVIRPKTLAAELGVEQLVLINDFAAMAAAVGRLHEDELIHLGGPEGAMPESGVVTIAGPGTGLGVAQLLRYRGRNIVLPTEGGHLDFAPLDGFEEHMLQRLRQRHVRVSTERIASGPGLHNIYEAMAASTGEAIVPLDDPALWQAAIDGSNRLAASALDRFVMAFGSIVGDLALGHGSNAVVITGGLANRIRERLAGPLFRDRFCAKGRHASRMANFPIRLAVHSDPGLLGAAAAFQEEKYPWT